MKVVLSILSDIHFSAEARHPIASRAQKIGAAIASTEPSPNLIILLFSGDVANSGRQDEYAIAKNFVSTLVGFLTSRFPATEVKVLSIPGNHDLEHPEKSEEYRATVVEGSTESMVKPHDNLFFLEKLLDPQRSYIEFENAWDSPGTDTPSRIVRTCQFGVGSHKIKLNLVNSALCSQLHEKQGTLLLPLPLLEEHLVASTSPDLTITAMHHPTFWLESQTLTALRDLISQTSEYLITGHQHFSSGYEVKTDLGESIRYFESPALFDPQKPIASAFRVLLFDLQTSREKQFIFSWTRELYKLKRESEFEWRDLSNNRISRQSLVMNPDALRRYSDPGFACPRRPSTSTSLHDIFEYPNLKLQTGNDSKDVDIKPGKQALSFLMEDGIKELHGAPLCGKSSLSKALVLDIRLRGTTTPMWMDGKEIRCSTIEEFERNVRRSFEEQYQTEQIDSFYQLAPARRCLIVDDWHLAHITSTLRKEIYSWMAAFFGSAVLMVDETYRVRELLAKRPEAKALLDKNVRNIARVEISSLSHVGTASLIHKYLRISRPQLDAPEESKEANALERLVSEMLGKDRLPAYPFFILSILQAIDAKKTNAIAGGSHGPLYEIVILSAMSANTDNDPDVSKKLVFLQEIAFRMWRTKSSVISPIDIQDVMTHFTSTNYLTLPTERYLDALLKAKILTRVDGNYTFTYGQYLYYFIARYIREHIENPSEAEELGREVDRMIDEISTIENSSILMFLIYFEKDKNRIIDRLLQNAGKIYGSTAPACLEGDVARFDRPRGLDLPLEEEPDVAGNRESVRAFKDHQESKRVFDPKTQFEIDPLSAYEYREDLPEACKLHLVNQAINALGQVIRNFSANLPGPRKVEILKATYLLSLRAVARVNAICQSVIDSVEKYLSKEGSELSTLELKQLTEELFTFLPILFAASMCEKVTESVGIADMDRAYQETAQELGKSIAIRLIDLAVKLHHFEGFPEETIQQLHSDVKRNPFALSILEILVISYFLLNKSDEATRKRTLRVLGIKPAMFDLKGVVP